MIDLKPKIAFDNYTGEEISWKKGDLIGYWAIMRKAFTPKMKKQIRVEFTDAASLKSVSDETETQIQAELNNDDGANAFKENIKDVDWTYESVIVTLYSTESTDKTVVLRYNID